MKIAEEKGTQLIERKEIKDSPMTIVKTDKGYFTAIGKYRLCDFKETKDEALKSTELTWDNIINVMAVVHESYEEIKQLKNNKN